MTNREYFERTDSENQEHEKNLEIGENFMNELYELAENFTPLYENGKKVVYFDVEKKFWELQKIEFWDKRKDYMWDEESEPDHYSLAGVELIRGRNGSSFLLRTYWPMYTSISAWSHHINHNRPMSRTSSTLGFSWLRKEAYTIPSLLKVIENRVDEAERIKNIFNVNENIGETLVDVLSKNYDKKNSKKIGNKK